MSSLNDEPVADRPPALPTRLASKIGTLATDLPGRSTFVRYRALAWLTAAASLAYLCRNAIGVAESEIRHELGLTLKESGWVMGAFFWTYAVFQVPSGWFSERVGTRTALSIFTLAWSVAMLGISLAPGFGVLIVAQLTVGVAQAGLMPSACNSIGHWMPLAQRSMACGILGAGLQVGAVAASGLTSVMVGPLGWRLVFVAFALPGIVWTLGFFARFRDDPAEVLPADSSELELIRPGRNVDDPPRREDAGEANELLAIARMPSMWCLCGQQMCRSAGYMFFASWFPTFLQRTRGLSVEESGYLQGVVLGGALLGCIFGGLLTDWIWRLTGSLRASRSGVGAASLATCAIVTLAAWLVESTEAAVLLLAVGAFCAAFAGPCAFAAAIDVGGQRVPQVAGMMNMSGNLAAAACPVLVGSLFQWTENWNLILLVFAGVFFAGATCWLFVNPDGKRKPFTHLYN